MQLLELAVKPPQIWLWWVELFKILQREKDVTAVEVSDHIGGHHNVVIVIKSCQLVNIQSTWAIFVELSKQLPDLLILANLQLTEQVLRLHGVLIPLKEALKI